MPRRQLAIGVQAGFDVDDRGRTEIGPGEFFFAGPLQRHGFAGRPGQARGFHGGLACVFAAESAAKIGHDHPHAVVGHVERADQFAPATERIRRTGPDGQLVAVPLGHGGPRFHGRVLDVSHVIGLLESFAGIGQFLGIRIFRRLAAHVLAQIVEYLLA